MNFFRVFLLFILAQRAFELVIARNHEKRLKNVGATEIDKSGYRFIVGMHIAFFGALILEKFLLHRSLNTWWIIPGIFFCAAQFLRYLAIASLGIYWNTKIIVAPRHPILKKGPYKILRHPNYLAVVTELAVVPLIFSCYITSISFTILNAFIIRRRIRIEMRSLE